MSTAVAYPTTAELTLQAKHFEGPLPPPEQLKQYEEVSPGFAERIVQMAEKEQDFRHRDTDRIRGMQRKIIGRGQVFGFIGGRATARKLTAAQRSASASKAARARWKKRKQKRAK